MSINERQLMKSLGTLPALERGPFVLALGWPIALGCALLLAVWAPEAIAGTQLVCWSSWSPPQPIPPVPADATNLVSIAIGAGHVLALRSDGTAVSWGWDSFGETNVPAGLSNLIAVAAPSYHSLAVSSAGGVVAWGYNSCGQTNVPEGITNVVAVSAAMNTDLALTHDGRVLSWGHCSSPPPPELRDVVAISAGYYDNYAVRDDGTLVSWGGNPWVLPYATNVMDVVGDLALRPDGTVFGLHTGYGVPGISNAVAITPGGMGLRRDGIVVDWTGAPTGPPGLTNVVAIASDGSLNVALVGDGSPHLIPLLQEMVVFAGKSRTLRARAVGAGSLSYQWSFEGDSIPGATNSWLGLTNLATSQSGRYAVIVTNDLGSARSEINLRVVPNTPVVAWGYNAFGQSSVPSSLEGVQAIAAGDSFSLALLTNGTVVSWGHEDGRGAVPLGLSNVIQIAAGGAHSLALLSNGTVVAWGDDTVGQSTPPPGLTGVISVACGAHHSLALTRDATVVAWGYNASGQATVPPGLKDVVAIAGGYDQSLALKRDGTVIAWGDNAYGQSSPPSGLANTVAIAGGKNFSIALKADGRVAAWGDDFGRVVSASSSFSNLAAVSAGFYHVLAVSAEGHPVAWGNNYYDQANVFAPVAAPLHNVVSVAAGDEHSLALVGTTARIPVAPTVNPSYTHGEFALEVQTQTGHVYRLESKDALDAAEWTGGVLAAGTGQNVRFADNSVKGSQRFYRVRWW